MSFQTPITIAQAIEKIESNAYLLPAIQREFVWSPEQIERLFDSIMRDYPISSFLFWEVKDDSAKKGYKFYKFINEYRERYKTHNDEISTAGLQSFYAILDGQQRLTSLYLGLKGSYAYKEYKKKWENTERSIPTRHLYLNITEPLKDEEDGRIYEFKFLNKAITQDEELYKEQEKDKSLRLWFKVGEILNYDKDEKFDEFVEDFDNKFSRTALRQLRRSILEKPLINYFLENEQNLDKALNIFIRINNGGEPLNFSDLIMSIAVANWEQKDARKEIHQLVDSIRDKDFNISKDLILKTFLFLYSPDIKFKVTNFSKENAKEFEQSWEKIRDCILSVFDLVKTFGFTDYTLTSKNALLPIIYYIYHKDIYKDFSTRIQYEKDREIIKKWLHNVLVKQVFGGAADAVLSQIRKTFTNDVTKQFVPQNLQEFPTEFKNISRDLTVSDEFIEELLYTQKDDKYAFSILSLLYPNLDYKNNQFHKDHVHPEHQFEELPSNVASHLECDDVWEIYNSIYNLQMLDANENMSKQHKSLIDWVELETQSKNKEKFLEEHLIPNVNLNLDNFLEYHQERKKMLIEKMKQILS